MGIDMNILNALHDAQIKDTECECHAYNVTPELAKSLLGINSVNRNIRDQRVNALAKEMVSGKFTLSPNPICIDTNGRLVDGQHRLKAVVKSNMTEPMYIMIGVESGAVIDRGLARTLGDSLYIRGLQSKERTAQPVIATATMYMEVMRNNHAFRATDSEMNDFLNEYGDETVAAVKVSSVGAEGAIGRKKPIRTAILGAIINNVPKDMLEEFARVMNTGYYDDNKQTAAIMLRNYLLNVYKSNASLKDAFVLCAVTEMCIQDFVKGVPRKQMYRTLRHVYINGKEETWPKAG